MCGIQLKSRTARAELNSRLGIEQMRLYGTIFNILINHASMITVKNEDKLSMAKKD